jgi:hypothetical protein
MISPIALVISNIHIATLINSAISCFHMLVRPGAMNSFCTCHHRIVHCVSPNSSIHTLPVWYPFGYIYPYSIDSLNPYSNWVFKTCNICYMMRVRTWQLTGSNSIATGKLIEVSFRFLLVCWRSHQQLGSRRSLSASCSLSRPGTTLSVSCYSCAYSVFEKKNLLEMHAQEQRTRLRWTATHSIRPNKQAAVLRS